MPITPLPLSPKPTGLITGLKRQRLGLEIFGAKFYQGFGILHGIVLLVALVVGEVDVEEGGSFFRNFDRSLGHLVQEPVELSAGLNYLPKDEKVDQKVDQKFDQKFDQKVDQKVDQKDDQKIDQKVDQKVDLVSIGWLKSSSRSV